MAQAGPSTRRQNLVCAVCREVYRSPRLLPRCHHSFCLGCLEGLARTHGRSFPCPACRAVVRVPGGGVGSFPVNFYLLEEDLERERNQAFKPLCEVHRAKELTLFCKTCDQAICTRCKLTKHEGHPTVDLSEAADQRKKLLKIARKRLGKSIKRLTKASALYQDNRAAAKAKANLIKKQIREQFEAIVKRATTQRDQVLQDVDRLSSNIDGDLNTPIIQVQRHLDSLIQLQQHVSHAIDGDDDAEVVAVEKEVREGKGSVEELERVEGSLPTSTQRPGLRGDLQEMEQVPQLFDTPVCLHLTSAHPAETVTPLARCEEGDCGRQVHALRQGSRGEIWVAYGGRAPDYTGKRGLRFDRDWDTCKPGEMQVVNRYAFMPEQVRTLNFFKYVSNRPVMHSTLLSNARYMPEKRQVILVHLCASFEIEDIHFDLEDASRPLAIDADVDRRLLTVLSEELCSPSSTHSSSTSSSQAVAASAVFTKRRVQMYVPNQSKPVSSYTPPQQPFFPSDICFLRGGDRPGPLLIADKATDSVHVVSVEDAQFQFLRYLAHGSPDLLQPTALDSFWGKVVIGCENGWILSCENVAHQDETEETEEEGGEEDGEGSSDGGSDGHSDDLLLNVEIFSDATTSSVHS